MRALLQPRFLRLSAPLGLGLALLCVPLIRGETGLPRLQSLQLTALPVLCVLLLQAALAWAGEPMRRLPGAASPAGPLVSWLELALLALVVALMRVGSDIGLRRLLFIPEVRDWGAFWRKLPFAGLVQPLFLVLGVYAFALRLCHRERWAVASVLLVHQGIVLLQFGSRVGPVVLALLLVWAGFHGLVAGLSFCRYGVCGPFLLALVGFGRHAAYILWPAMATWGTG